MSRHLFTQPIAEHITNVRSVLSAVPANKRLQVIAEALYSLNPTGADEVLKASCGCYEWDISMDYRNADIRYPEKEEPKQ